MDIIKYENYKKESFIYKEDFIYTLGKVGFDKIVITNFDLNVKVFKEPFEEHYIENICKYEDIVWDVEYGGEYLEMGRLIVDKKKTLEKFAGLKEKSTVKLSKSWMTINELPVFKFSIGNVNGKAICYLELHSQRQGNNLENMSMKDVWSRLDKAKEWLSSQYNITLEYDKDRLCFHRGEINKTFPLRSPFNNYTRILSLLSYKLQRNSIDTDDASNEDDIILPDKKSHNKASQFFSRAGNTTVTETYSLRNGNNKEIICYDKSAQLRDAKPYTIYFDTDLMRMEIRIKKAESARSLTTPRSTEAVYLSKITDEDVERYFYGQFERLFDKVENYLNDNLFPYARKPLKNAPDTEPMTAVLNTMLRLLLRSQPESFIEMILAQMTTFENNRFCPVLLDITDIIGVLDKYTLSETNKNIIKEHINKILSHPELYDDVCKRFINQRQLYDEIKANLTDNIDTGKIFLTANDKKDPRIRTDLVGIYSGIFDPDDPTFELKDADYFFDLIAKVESDLGEYSSINALDILPFNDIGKTIAIAQNLYLTDKDIPCFIDYGTGYFVENGELTTTKDIYYLSKAGLKAFYENIDMFLEWESYQNMDDEYL